MYYLKGIEANSLFSWKSLLIAFVSGTAYSLKGENGSGKSSIFEIIIWVLFKKTTKKNVKGNYGKDHGWGKVTLSDGKNDFVIQRDTETPMQILMNGKNITQEYLESFIGGNYSVFMASNFCSQKRVSSFVNEASDTGKAKIFGEMLGCDVLDKIRGKVQKKKNEYEVSYEAASSKVQTLEETIEGYAMDMEEATYDEYVVELDGVKGELKAVEEKKEKAELKYDNALKRNKSWDSYDNEMAVIRKHESTLSMLQANLDGLTEAAADFDMDALDDEKQVAVGKASSYASKSMEATTLKRSAQSEISKLKDILAIEGDCPTCGSKVTKTHRAHVTEEIQRLKKSISEKVTDVEKYTRFQSKYNKKSRAIIDRVNEGIRAIQARDSALEQVKDLRENISILKKNLRKPKNPRQDTEDLLIKSRELAREASELDKEVSSRVKVIEGYTKAFSRLEEAKEVKRKKEGVYTTYSWLFKHIPLMKLRFINDNKVALEDVINEYISKMGLSFMVKIETSKELKSTKEIKEAFSFQIINTLRKQKADKKDLSGGEETCILLATQFGISDVAGTNLDFEIYDEVYGSLDNKNLASVIEALLDRANGKQLFSISHKDEISHSFPNIIEVEKKDGYSRTRG